VTAAAWANGEETAALSIGITGQEEMREQNRFCFHVTLIEDTYPKYPSTTAKPFLRCIHNQVTY
jgi:hypothetical protein